MDTEPEREKVVHLRPHPTMKVSDREWELIRDLVCAGASATELAEKYGIEPNTIHRRASVEKWPTPKRILKAQQKGLPADDPAAAIARMWSKRQGESREDAYQGAKKALDRFWAKSPVPTSFQEAAIAQKMLDKAIDPTEGKATMDDPNLQLLVGRGMDVIDVEEVEETQNTLEEHPHTSP